VVEQGNPDYNKVFTMQFKKGGYVFYVDQTGEDYAGKVHNVEYRIANKIWVEVKQPRTKLPTFINVSDIELV
jgi:hypothetical protein